ncbi:hypothetical protein RvY_04287-1 [Ramazzottius varieornatus]|uniref:Uncharacterized protein n=1 Tax=Ramazzottius varieornatus TaxID=947166 RepID=A0A1D1V0E3_RAMVA|nr:hypothetical protein RvY_04287-1 [Ramazzottius varieornatus]
MDARVSMIWILLSLGLCQCESSGGSPFGGISFPSFGSGFGNPSGGSGGFGNFGSPMSGFGNFGNMGNNQQPSPAVASPTESPAPSPSPSPSPSQAPSAPASSPTLSPSTGNAPKSFGSFGGSGGFNPFGGSGFNGGGFNGGNFGGGNFGGNSGNGGFPSFSGFGMAPASNPGSLQGSTGVAGQNSGRGAQTGGSSSIRAGVQQGTNSDTTTDGNGNQQTNIRATPMIFSFGGSAQPNQSGGSGNTGGGSPAPAAGGFGGNSGGFNPFGGSGSFSPFGGTQGGQSSAPSGGSASPFGGSLFGVVLTLEASAAKMVSAEVDDLRTIPIHKIHSSHGQAFRLLISTLLLLSSICCKPSHK